MMVNEILYTAWETDNNTTSSMMWMPYNKLASTATNYYITTNTSTAYCPYDEDDGTWSTINYTQKMYRKIRATVLGDAWENWITCKYDWDISQTPARTPAERLREIIRTRQAPLIIGSRTPVKATVDPKEIRARETLLRVLGEEKFRGFVRNGFVTVRGKSGKVYQIFPGHGITKVYQNGQMIDRLCVVLRGDFPPTDSVIMRFLLILNDEAEFYRLAVKHSVAQQSKQLKVMDLRPLPEIYRGLVAA